MDFSNLKGKIFFKDRFILAKKANIHVLNHSLHFASAVFEGIRVYNKKTLFLKDHVTRLLKSSKIMCLKVNHSQSKLCKIILKLIKLNNINYGYVRPVIFRSSHSMSPDTTNCKSLIAIACWKWGKLYGSEKGITLDISRFPRLNSKIYPIQAKSSGSYQTSVISMIESRKKNFEDCLMLDLNKNVAESSACNIFWIKNNTVYTPKEHSILNGVTRKAVIKICKKNKINLKVGDYKLSHLLSSESIFLTGTAAEIQTVRKICNYNFKVNSKIIELLKKHYEFLKKRCPDKVDKI